MLFLFLDCETTGLVKSDQIMELGAVLVDFDETNWQMIKISEFETLVKIDVQIDEKISRITGIDNQTLANAPKLELAQNFWQGWLLENIENYKKSKNKKSKQIKNKIKTEKILEKVEDKNWQKDWQNSNSNLESWEGEDLDLESWDKIVIIGHSLAFDLGFLERENWFLPRKFEKIDTLDLSKIFLPFTSAVNLEFLTKKLNLMKNDLKVQDEKLGEKLGDLDNLNNFHRAKFDTKCCQELLKYLLDLFIFCYSLDKQKVYFTDKFFQKLEEFLPLKLPQPIEKFAKNNLESSKNQQEIQEKIQTPKIINLQGLEMISAEEKLTNWSKIEPNKLQKVLNQNLPKNLNLLTLQLFFISFFNQNYSKLTNFLEEKALSKNQVSQNSGQIKPQTLSFKLHTQKDLFVIAELFLENR